jgi:hypothetical protein
MIFFKKTPDPSPAAAFPEKPKPNRQSFLLLFFKKEGLAY